MYKIDQTYLSPKKQLTPLSKRFTVGKWYPCSDNNGYSLSIVDDLGEVFIFDKVLILSGNLNNWYVKTVEVEL